MPIPLAIVSLVGWLGAAQSETAARWNGETPTEHAVRSAPGGEFSVENLLPGLRYEVRVSARGFAPRTAGPVSAGPGETASVGDIILQGGGRASGRVVDEQDRPVRGATVGGVPLPALGKTEELLPFLELETGAGTDADGAFTLSNLPPGRFLLLAQAAGFAAAKAEVGIDADSEASGVVLRLGAGGTIAGSVHDAHGDEVEGAIVRAEARGAGPSFLVEADDFGDFEIEAVPEGIAYRLLAEAHGFGAGSFEPARAGDEEIEIRLHPRGAIRGEIVEAGTGGGVEYARVGLVSDRPDWRLPVREIGTERLQSIAQDDGTFAIAVPEPGRYRVVAVAPGFAPGASGPVDVAGAAVEGIEVRLDRGAEVRGVVRGGGKLLPAEVSLLEPPRPGEMTTTGEGLRVPSQGTLLARTTADGQGRFAFERVPPGRYLLEASHEGFPPARTEPFETREGERRVEKTIELLRAGKIRGSVRASSVDLATLKVVSTGPDGSCLEAPPDGTGSYSITGAVPGAHLLLVVPRARPLAEFYGLDAAMAKKGALAWAEAEVSQGGVASADFDLTAKRGSTIRGVVRRNGLPGTGLSVAREGDSPLAPGRPGLEAPTDEEGRFTLEGVPPGPVTLLVRPAVQPGGFGPVLGKATLDVPEGRAADVTVAISTARIRGRAVRGDGSGVAGARISVAVDAANGGAGDLVPATIRWGAVASEDGSFDAGEAPAGAYLVTAQSTGLSSSTVQVMLVSGADFVGEIKLTAPPGR